MAEHSEMKLEKQIAVINQRGNKTLELNIVSYDNTFSKYDLRLWRIDEEGRHIPSVGVSMSTREMANLKAQLEEMSFE